MKGHQINCPNCNSPQNFAPRERVENEIIVKYICCLMCRTEFTVDTYPATEKKKRERAVILKLRKIRRETKFNNG